MNGNTSLVGGMLAMLVLAGTVGMVWWLTVAPGPAIPAVRRARRSSLRVLVPIGEAFPVEPALEVACRLAREQHGVVILLYVYAVPATLPIDACLPTQEAAGRRALAAAAEVVAAAHRPARTHLVPSRSFADTILRVAEYDDVDVLVLGIGQHRGLLGDSIGGTARKLMRLAPCEVVLVRPAPAGSVCRLMAESGNVVTESVFDLPVLATGPDHDDGKT